MSVSTATKEMLTFAELKERQDQEERDLLAVNIRECMTHCEPSPT